MEGFDCFKEEKYGSLGGEKNETERQIILQQHGGKGFCSYVTWLKGMKRDVRRVVKVLDWFGFGLSMVQTHGDASMWRTKVTTWNWRQQRAMQSTLRPSSNQTCRRGESTVFPILQSCCSCGDNRCRLLRRLPQSWVTLWLPITRLGDLSPVQHSSLRDSAVGLVLFLMWGRHQCTIAPTTLSASVALVDSEWMQP